VNANVCERAGAGSNRDRSAASSSAFGDSDGRRDGLAHSDAHARDHAHAQLDREVVPINIIQRQLDSMWVIEDHLALRAHIMLDPCG
jgi:hypothetical protein